MARRKIIWSLRAQQDRIDILDYWINRTKSTAYSRKLFDLFNSAVELISIHPEIGKPTNLKGIRAKVVRDYLIIYEDRETHLDILMIWDSRQNPNKLKNILN